MTDQSEDMPQPDWGSTESWDSATPAVVPPGAVAAGVNVQPAVYDLADHVYTLSISPRKAPMLVVRAQSVTDLKARLEECDAEGVWIQIAEAQALADGAQTAANTIVQQLGATPVTPQGYPQQQPYQPPQQAYPGPPVPPPGPPPFGAPTAPLPAAQAAAGWGAGARTSAAPPGWFRVNAPFTQRAAFDAVKMQFGADARARNPYMRFDKDTKTWFVNPDVVQHFAQWGPQPA